MKKKSTLKEIINVSISNLCIVFSGIFVGFLIPKILGVTEYGYYKIFTLYATYIGIFTFGISEGLYLKYSGVQYENLDMKGVRFFTRLVVALQILVAVVLSIIALFCLHGEYKIIFLAISIYLIELNITTYYQYIAQMTMRFKDYSARNIIKSVLTICSVILMYIIYYFQGKKFLSYRYYIFFVLCISTVLLIMYIIKYKDVTFGVADNWKDRRMELVDLMKMGIPFVIGTLCSTLILSIDRQFVSVGFDTSTYGIYAFAYNMLSLVTVCTSAISTVLYPTLKQSKDGQIKEKFPVLVTYVSVFIFFALNSYFPLTIFVKWFLPQYVESLEIFRIVFPGLAFSAVISVVMQNYYKLLEKNVLYFVINLGVLVLSVITNFIAYHFWKTPSAISWASIFTLILYYLIAEHYFIKNYRIYWKKNITYSIIMSFLFYLITAITNIYVGFTIYLVASIVVAMLFYNSELRVACNKIIKK